MRTKPPIDITGELPKWLASLSSEHESLGIDGLPCGLAVRLVLSLSAIRTNTADYLRPWRQTLRHGERNRLD